MNKQTLFGKNVSVSHQFLEGEYVWISSKNLSGWWSGYGLGRVQPPNSTSRSRYMTSVAPALGDGYDPEHTTRDESRD